MKAVSLPSRVQARLLTGLTAPAQPAAMASLDAQAEAPLSVVFLNSLKELAAWNELLPFYYRLQESIQPQITVLPPEAEEDEERRAYESACDRLAALTELNRLRNDSNATHRLILLTTPKALFAPVPPSDALSSAEVVLQVGQTVDFKAFCEQLGHELGYDHEAVCEEPGQYAVRGGLLDVYPLNADAPVRIDFFGDEIESLKTFDPTTQRSIESIDSVIIASFKPLQGACNERNILDYFGPAVDWYFIEPATLAEEHTNVFTTFERIHHSRATLATLFEDREQARDRFTGLAEFDSGSELFGEDAERLSFESERLEDYRLPSAEDLLGLDRVEADTASRNRLLEQMTHWRKDGATIHIVVQNSGEAERLQQILDEQADWQGVDLQIVEGPIRRGFYGAAPAEAFTWPGAAPGKALLLATASDIFARYRQQSATLRQRRRVQRQAVDQLLDFSELAEGDFLVHMSHGVCLYKGLQRMELGGREEEVISLEFDEDLTLHLPLQESHLLSRYVGLSKITPRLGRLGTNQWDKTRKAAEKATLDFAAELLKLQAARESHLGHAFSPDTEWQRTFENAFPHQETPDQMRAINDAKADMEQPQAMDRLICGDVGFGKTEVAIRAAFKAVMEGKQVAVLVPTTVLAQQHFNTFQERLAEYPFTVEMLSRFRAQAQQTAILKQVEEGKVDVLIGTHRLLSKDVIFKDLGLLIVDEEHRFGVRHKERLKQMSLSVDVLSMSATPIPRTLYLALMGARQLSVIETPPVDRLPIQTIVKSYDAKLVQRALRAELERGGQIFYLHNRVGTIEEAAERLQEMAPKARIAIGHGQMTEHMLEKVMTRFVAGEYDILVCTTIIESGLDIPNCNTLIIEGADRFGLSQLYQLRGRVGRFNRQAYAYLLLHRHSRVLDQARKRLAAMRQHNQLGAGFRIAMRDLELRGAGNILGAQQSGHIAGVGFDLYCSLLRQSIAKLKGDACATRVRASVRLDFVVEGRHEERGSETNGKVAVGYEALREAEMEGTQIDPIEAYLPAAYINEAQLRIHFYRQLAMADAVESLRSIRASLEDRFGPIDRPTEALLKLTEIRIWAELCTLRSVESEGNRLKCRRASGKVEDYLKIGNRFPRLSQNEPMERLSEIINFLKQQVHA